MISEDLSRIKATSTPPWDENARIAALRSYGILDTPREPEFDDLVKLAATLFSCPIALISLIEDDRQWFKAEVGLGNPGNPRRGLDLLHVLLRSEPLIVSDLTADARFSCNPLVTGTPNLRFYAGAPLTTADRMPLGSFCVLDFEARTSPPISWPRWRRWLGRRWAISSCGAPSGCGTKRSPRRLKRSGGAPSSFASCITGSATCWHCSAAC